VKRVTSLPQVTLASDGVLWSQKEGGGLSEVSVRQGLSVPALCELTFVDPPGPLEVPARMALGSQLMVTVRGHDVALFEGEVTAVEHVFNGDGSREVRVRAYDISHRLRKRQQVRGHVHVTARGLAEELGRDVGLTVEGSEDGPEWQLLIQHRQTDFELLVEVLERCGLFYWVRGEQLNLLTLEGLSETVPLKLGESLLEARAEANADPACLEVAVAGWDVLDSEVHEGRADSARSGRQVSAEVGDAALGGGGKRSFPEEATPDDRHAEAIAEAELDVRKAREVTFWGVAEGDPRLAPGTRIDVSGVGDLFAGTYVLTAARHTIDDRLGYATVVETAPPRLRPRPAAAVATEGIVTQVDDPDSRGRVKAKLPAYFNVETGWREVLSVGAGRGKGLVILPDVDDTVLVLLAHQDPAEGVVLGGLYGTGGSPDAGGVSGTAVKRYALLTPGGQKVRLDDERGSLRVEDSHGSFVELAPDRVTLHAATELEISAPGRRVVIRGQAIDLESG
jgi:phage baseplate assembly protein gpV/phage protein D